MSERGRSPRALRSEPSRTQVRLPWTPAGPATPTAPSSPSPGAPPIPDPALTIYYDGHCRLCRDQRDRFARLDAGRGLLRQVDLNDPGFDPAALGTTRETLATALHASTPDGRLLSGMDAVRAAYRAVGKGWLTAPTGWPLLRPIFDALYRQLARHRYRIGGRCENGACKLHE